MSKIELRPDANPPKGHDTYPAMDEITATGVDVHFERMNGNLVWVDIERPGKKERVVVILRAKGDKLFFGAQEE